MGSIRTALDARDEAALSRLASCRFAIGPMDSDVGSPVGPERIAPVILRVSATFDWSSLTIQEHGFTVMARDGKEHLFQIHGTADRWRWTVYATTDQSVLDELDQRETID
jgi:hypothetical protein